MKIYIGNISRESTENEIRDLFAEFGEITEMILIRDNYTKVLKGFGFVEMADKDAAEKAIKELDGQLFNGRPLTVNVASRKPIQVTEAAVEIAKEDSEETNKYF